MYFCLQPPTITLLCPYFRANVNHSSDRLEKIHLARRVTNVPQWNQTQMSFWGILYAPCYLAPWQIKYKDALMGAESPKHTLHSQLLFYFWILPQKNPSTQTSKHANKQTHSQANHACPHKLSLSEARHDWMSVLLLCSCRSVTWEAKPRQTGQQDTGAGWSRMLLYAGGDHILLHPQRLKCHPARTDATSTSRGNVMSSSAAAFYPSEYKTSEGYERSLPVIALFRQAGCSDSLSETFKLLFTLVTICIQIGNSRGKSFSRQRTEINQSKQKRSTFNEPIDNWI